MVSNAILIGITIGVFFVGIGISYAIFSSTDNPNTMKLANQELFDQMMSQNPKMTQQWMDSSMMQSPEQMQQMMSMMMQNQEFMLSVLQLEKHDRLHELTSCSSDWYITGYFIPIESDYSGKFSRIVVDNEARQFKIDFLKVVKTEGWGKTLSNDYLGWYDKSYHLSDTALDSIGEPLSLSSVAVDSSIIDENTELFIPSLPEPWDNIVFTANDEGPSIKDKHIDVFVGEGKIAEEESYRITGYENEVCIR